MNGWTNKDQVFMSGGLDSPTLAAISTQRSARTVWELYLK